MHVPHVNGADVNWLYGHAEIINREEPDDEGQTYEVRVDPRQRAAFAQRFSGRNRRRLAADRHSFVSGAMSAGVAFSP